VFGRVEIRGISQSTILYGITTIVAGLFCHDNNQIGKGGISQVFGKVGRKDC